MTEALNAEYVNEIIDAHVKETETLKNVLLGVMEVKEKIYA